MYDVIVIGVYVNTTLLYNNTMLRYVYLLFIYSIWLLLTFTRNNMR